MVMLLTFHGFRDKKHDNLCLQNMLSHTGLMCNVRPLSKGTHDSCTDEGGRQLGMICGEWVALPSNAKYNWIAR